MRYRIRWGNVQYGNGRSLSTERMCIAERKTAFFGIWWPIADWRFHEGQAKSDINADIARREPLPDSKEYQGRIDGAQILGKPPTFGTAVSKPPPVNR